MFPALEFARFEQIKATGQLPSPKGVALAIMRAVQTEDVSLAELGRIVRSDPAFSGRLLKAANGLLGYGRRPVASPQDALTVLGLPTIRSLALCFSLLGEYRKGACAAFDYEAYWSSSVACAVAMQVLTQRTRAAPADEAYSVGLLCRVGELALATLYPQRYDELLKSLGDEPLELSEQAAFALSHRELSVAMLRDWGMPEVFVEVVFHHEQVSGASFAEASRDQLLLHSLSLARMIADTCLAAQSPDAARLSRMSEQAAVLGLDPIGFAELCDRVAQGWQQWGALLEVKTHAVPSFSGLLQPQQAPVEAPPAAAALSTEADAAAQAASDAPHAADTREAHLSVLVVERDDAVRANIAQLLRAAGHAVHEAEQLGVASEMALLLQPHMMIVDSVLPDGAGLDLVASLRQTRAGRSVYVLVLTDSEDEQGLIEAFEQGVDDFMTKPLNPRVLMARMRAGLRVIRLNQEIERDREELRNFATELAVSNRRLREVALSDPLTGFPNQRSLLERMEQEWASSKRSARPLTAMVVQFEGLASMRASQGTEAADQLLRAAARSLRQTLRAPDVLGREEGERFIILCPDTDRAEAVLVAERLRRSITQLKLELADAGGSLRAVVGYAVRDSAMSAPSDLLALALSRMRNDPEVAALFPGLPPSHQVANLSR